MLHGKKNCLNFKRTRRRLIKRINYKQKQTPDHESTSTCHGNQNPREHFQSTKLS